jgi:hypothetical protein
MSRRWALLILLAACSPGNSSPTDSGAPNDLLGGPQAVLLPLAVGNQWTYASTVLGTGTHCGQTLTQTVTGANPTAGRPAFQVTTLCPPPTMISTESYSVPTAGGDEVDYDYQGAWTVAVDPTLVDGHSWPSTQGTTRTWQRVQGSVTVPAGTFADCWTAKSSQTGNVFNTYCRGVGLVISHFDDSGNGAESRLTSKSF